MPRRRAITLVELLIVVIILGILASLGGLLFTKTAERSRTAEAKSILGFIKSAEEAYKLEYNTYSEDFTELAVDAPVNCQDTHFYSYSVAGNVTANTFTALAVRCSSGGKEPDSANEYTISINERGKLTVPSGL